MSKHEDHSSIVPKDSAKRSIHYDIKALKLERSDKGLLNCGRVRSVSTFLCSISSFVSLDAPDFSDNDNSDDSNALHIGNVRLLATL